MDRQPRIVFLVVYGLGLRRATSRRTLVLDEFLAGELFDHLGRSRYQGDGERVFCHPLKGSTLDHKRYAARSETHS